MKNQILIVTDTYRNEEKEEYQSIKEIVSPYTEKVMTPIDI